MTCCPVEKPGSGKRLTDTGQIVVVNRESKDGLMELVGFGKGQGFAYKASQALAQGVEPALDMRRLAAVLADRPHCARMDATTPT